MPFPYTFEFTFDDNLYKCLIDWDNSGVFGDSTGEQLFDRVLAEAPVRIARGRDTIRSLSPPMVGTFDCELWNASKDYSPESTGSPLYGNLLPGRGVHYTVSKGGTLYPLFTGTIDNLQVHPEWGSQSVTVSALGPLAKLRGRLEGLRISTQLYSAITTDQALGYLLDAVGWSAAKRTLDTGQTTLAYWWLDEQDAFQAAEEILNTEGPGSSLYEDADGNIVFESRTYRLTTARCTSAQATFSGSGTEPMHSEPFVYDPRYKDVINVCTITRKARQVESVQKIWGLEGSITMAPFESRVYKIKHSDPFQAAVTPVSGTDYTLSAGSFQSVSLNRTSGANCALTLTAAWSGATFSGLQLRAQPVTIESETLVSNTIDATASIAKYGQRVYNYRTREEISLNTAQDFANAIVGMYQEPVGVIEITVTGNNDARQQQALAREISDRISVSEGQTGLSAACFINRIEHNIEYGGRLHTVKFGLEKTSGVQYFTLDTSTLGGSDVLGW